MAAKVKQRDGRTDSPHGLVVAGLVVGGVVGLLGSAFAGRWLAVTLAPVLYRWADGDHARLVAILLSVWGLFPVGCVAAWWVGHRWGKVWGLLAAVPLAPVGLFLFGTVPGRNNDGRLSRSLTEAVGGGLADPGEVFTACALAGFVGTMALGFLAGFLLSDPRRRTRGRVGLVALVTVGAWVAIGALVVAVVGDTDPRGDWLDRTADQVRGGDDGLTGDFPVGLEPSVLDVVDCETAARALMVDGDEPELDGCRKALLVAATGRYDADGRRVSSGELVAVVLQVGTEDQLDDLDQALDGVELVAGDQLPEPPDTTLASKATAALALVVAAEDTGDIPLPEEGAGRRPLTRALAYVVIGTAQDFYLAPPDEPVGPTGEPEVTGRTRP